MRRIRFRGIGRTYFQIFRRSSMGKLGKRVNEVNGSTVDESPNLESWFVRSSVGVGLAIVWQWFSQEWQEKFSHPGESENIWESSRLKKRNEKKLNLRPRQIFSANGSESGRTLLASPPTNSRALLQLQPLAISPPLPPLFSQHNNTTTPKPQLYPPLKDTQHQSHVIMGISTSTMRTTNQPLTEFTLFPKLPPE